MATNMGTLSPAQEQMIANSPLRQAISANPQLAQALATRGNAPQMTVKDSTGKEWHVEIKNGQINASSGHPIRNSLLGLAAEVPGIAGMGIGGAGSDALVNAAATTAPTGAGAGVAAPAVAGGMTATGAAGSAGDLGSSILGSSAAEAGNTAASSIPTLEGASYFPQTISSSPSLAGAINPATGLPVMGQSGGLLSKIGGLLKNPQSLADVGKVLGSTGEAEALNRYKKGEMTQGYDRLMLEAAANRRADEGDALRKLAVTNYLQNGGSHFSQPSIQLNGQTRTLLDYGFGPTPASDAQKSGASTLQTQMLNRLQPGGSYTPTPLDSYANRGALEKAGSYGGLVASGLGALGGVLNPTQPKTTQSSGPGIADVLKFLGY